MIEFYASDALICPRRVWFRLKGFPERWPEIAKPRLEKGIKTHEVLGRILEERFGFELEKEIILRFPRLGFEIHGRMDAYKEFPIEIKGKSSLPRFPLEYHLAQLNVYLRWSEAEYGYLYYLKLHDDPTKIVNGLNFDNFPRINGKNFKMFEVPYDPILFKETVKFFYDVKLYLDEDEIPPGTKGPHCKFCPYSYICFSHQLDEFL
ncbi:CRISPR-associated protein Cas4 [Pyrococcus kukulkanii]|uniref:CRISPR-associated protein Cas4 n=1 Tax=Pyrococcus kukulkanii TaxID=1609559 RepID=UPI003561C14B